MGYLYALNQSYVISSLNKKDHPCSETSLNMTRILFWSGEWWRGCRRVVRFQRFFLVWVVVEVVCCVSEDTKAEEIASSRCVFLHGQRERN